MVSDQGEQLRTAQLQRSLSLVAGSWQENQGCERRRMTAEASSPASLSRLHEKESCGATRSRENSASSVEGMQTRGRKRQAEQSAESEPKRPARRPVRCG